MEHLTIQEKPDSVASPGVCTKEQGAQSPSPSSDNNLDRISNSGDLKTTDLDPLLCRFLAALNAREVVSPRGYHTYRTFAFQPGAYTKTLESLRESDPEVWAFIEEELRHDLINDEFLIIKMNTRIHEMLTHRIGDLINRQLAAIVKKASNEDTKQLIEEIRIGLAAVIKFNGPKTFLMPDQQFFTMDTYYPSVVIEIAHTQAFKKVHRKVFNFIVRSQGKVQLVIGLETGKSSKLFNISAWRPKFYRSDNQDTISMNAVTDRAIIRDSDGTLKPGCFRFHLQDFGEGLATKYPHADLTKEITLDYHVLAEYLIDAERYQSPSPPPRRWSLKEEVYPSSSEEELETEDKKWFEGRECKSAARSEALDPDYA